MPVPALENLVGRGLKVEPPDAPELAALMRSGEARLRDAENAALSLESRFDLAYNAAHAICLASLRFHGYRPDNRYLVFQTLVHTVGLVREKWRVLDAAHQKRNYVEYEGMTEVDEETTQATIRVTHEVLAALQALMK
jgi:hypothetical protein